MESSESKSAATAAEFANQSVVAPAAQQDNEQKTENPAADNMVALTSTESAKCTDEASKESKTNEGKDGEQQKDVSLTTTEGKTEVTDGQRSSPRLQKKAKKTKKKEQPQQPVSEQAIPLPPPPPPPTETAK